MILEQLISAYLDGEMTVDQDRELRELVRTDPAAREAFDAAVLIHISMRCEDETLPPADLRSAVFDSVDAIAAENARMAQRPPERPRRSLRRIASAVAALIALWLPVSDGIVPADWSLPLSLMMGPDRRAQPVDAAIPIDELPEPPAGLRDHYQQVSDIQGVAEVERTVATTEAVHSEDGPALGEGRQPSIPLGTLFQGAVQPSIAMTKDAAGSEGGSPRHYGEVIPWHADDPVSVTLATSYAAGMGSTLASAQNVEQISASLAYGLTDDDAVGLEIGATSYSIAQTSDLLTTTEPVSSSMRSVVHGGDAGGKLASPEDEPGQYSVSTQGRTAQVRSMWGSAFYERRLLDLESVALFGRAGAGVSQDGLLGFGRLTGQWTVGAGISVVVGAEARSMPFQTGAGGAVASQIAYGAVVTAVTGLQVRF